MKAHLLEQHEKRCVFVINGRVFTVDSNQTAGLSVVSVVRNIKQDTGLSLMESLDLLYLADPERVHQAAANWRRPELRGFWKWAPHSMGGQAWVAKRLKEVKK